MKSKSPVLIFEETYTCNIAGDLEAFIDDLRREALQRDFNVDIYPTEIRDNYIVNLHTKSARITGALYGFVSKVEEKTQISITVGIEPVFVFYFLISIVPILILLLSTIGQSAGSSLFVILVISAICFVFWGGQRFIKKSFVDLFNDVFGGFSI